MTDLQKELENIYGDDMSVLLDAKIRYNFLIWIIFLKLKSHAWIWDDREYARQRVAGMNPLVIKKAAYTVIRIF